MIAHFHDGDAMDLQMECMCLECGMSNLVDAGKLAFEDYPYSEIQVLSKVYCENCGGPLMLIGKAGEEPCYKVMN